jgi:hypothetical protein
MKNTDGTIAGRLMAVMLVAAGLFVTEAGAATVAIVVPNGLGGVEGNTDNGYPFSIGGAMRYQQIFGASGFSALPPGGGLITKIAFRTDGVYGATFSTTTPDVRISLSTSLAVVDGLNQDLLANIGADNTVVWPRGPLALSGSGGSSPNPFDVVITLTTPFLYNPANGNLLMDIQNFTGVFTPQFDASNITGDGTSRIYNVSDANATMASPASTDSIGMVAQFTFQPVPEPSVAMLLLPAVLALSKALRRRQLQ